MSAEYYYHKAYRYYGKPVEIRDRYGRIYRGVITRVNRQGVYVRGEGGGGFFFPFFTIVSLILLSSLFFF
ncbi:hypothetical protein ACLM5H_10140 [Fredinandcohnia humi]